jgi:hypothetical protein
MKWTKTVIYIFLAMVVSAFVRVFHLHSAHEAVNFSSVIVPTIVGGAIMLCGLLTDVSKSVPKSG